MMEYRNVFQEMNYPPAEVAARLKEIWEHLFVGPHKIYFENDDQTGYVVDTGNNDVRTEGMSYAMMLSVQYNRQDVFDKLWRWVKKFMWLTTGENKGYFAWSVLPNGEKNSNGPAPDGEEYFALALFFASHRFGNGAGILNYEQEARDILHVCLHKDEEFPGLSIWDLKNHLIKFVPNCDFTDPSYHLPHFYELFARWGNTEDAAFWQEAARASREFLVAASHPVTGLTAEYSEYDGTPKNVKDHDRFYSDAYRTAGNIGLANVWCGNSPALNDCVTRLQHFFNETVKGHEDRVYYIDGTPANDTVLHPVGLIAMNAMGSLATSGANATACVEKFWQTPLRTGERRYYDNFLYAFAFLALSGNYRIWEVQG